MKVMVILILFSIIVAGGFLIAFLVSLKRGQFDDMYTPSVRILFDKEMEDNDNNDRGEPVG